MLIARMKPSPARLHSHILPALAAFAAAFALTQLDLIQRIEDATLDWRTRLRAEWTPAKPSGEVLLVGVDEASLKHIGQWPFRRARHGDLMQLMAANEPSGPSVVGWDFLFTEPTPDDAAFAEGIAASGLDVVLGAQTAKDFYGVKVDSPEVRAARLTPLPRVEGDRSALLGAKAMILPSGPLATAAHISSVDTPPGSDGVRRTVPLVIRLGENVYPTLSLQILLRHWHALPEQVQVKLGDAILVDLPDKVWRIPIDERGRYYVNYRYPLEGYTRVGYHDLYSRLYERYEENKPTKVHPISERVVLIGQEADGLSDFGPSPFSPHTPLVMVHANILENVLAQDYVQRVPSWAVWALALGVGIAGILLFSHRPLWAHLTFALGVPLLYAGTGTLLWVQNSLALPLVMPIAGFGAVQVYMIARRVLIEQRSKEQIKGMFGTYVAPEVVKSMVEAEKPPELGGQELEITAYFSDIQSYSSFSEKLAATDLVELLNTYLTACTDIVVEQERGTLDKYIGDAVVAMFGAPLPQPDHAYRACLAALEVQAQLAHLRARWQREGARWPSQVQHMRTRIGLNTGRATVGNMGSRSRFNYTMTGDHVNLAARMESGAKHWGVYILCTEATRLACQKQGGDRVIFRPLGSVVVMGRTQAVPIHEVFALREDLTPQMEECLARFADGLARYHARDWSGASAAFEQAAANEPHQPDPAAGIKTNPSLVFLQLARAAAISPPPADWTGVQVMTEK